MLRKTYAAVVGGVLIGVTATVPGLIEAPAPVAAAKGMPVAPPAEIALATTAVPETPPVQEEQLAASARTYDKSERDRLATELGRWMTRDARQLVGVIADLAERETLPVAPTLMLSIAWAETRGKILAVSPAGAAGLAQATPAAYLLEGYDGKLYVTNAYLVGSRSYIMKKPLGDAMTIADRLIARNTPANRAEAKKLVAQAVELRREGTDELEALRPVANDIFFANIAAADERNLTRLQQLDALIDRGAPRAEMKRYRDSVSRDYRYMMNLQRNGWAKYARQLERRRDELLRKRYGAAPATVMLTRPYEAGEYLGKELDARFSPTEMAQFLAAHLDTKRRQAIELGIEGDDQLEAWTAALYNGGAVNVKRMRAGLISTLRETQNYMAKVPERRAQLDLAVGP